jgi:hypothetical protein
MRPLVLICLCLLCPLAAHAAASAPTETFLLSVSGTSTAVWDHTDCDSSLGSHGSRMASFRSSTPTVVRFVGDRVVPVDAHGIVGAVMLSGTNAAHAACSEDSAPTTQRCGRTTRRFANARVHVSTAGAGRIVVAAPRLLLRRGQCPREVADVVALPLGPPVGPLRISTHALADQRIRRITLNATASRRKSYGAAETGTLEQRSRWTLTFVRTGR